MKQTATVKDYVESLDQDQQVNYLLGLMTGEDFKRTIGNSKLPDEAVIFACRYVGALGLALEVLPNTKPEEREQILEDTFDWMRLHFTEVHAKLIKMYEEKYGRAQ